MLETLAAIVMILTTLIPLFYTMSKAYPWLYELLKQLWRSATGKNTAGRRSITWGLVMTLFSFVGGFGFFVSIYFGWGLSLYLSALDLIFTPFAYIAEHLIASFVSQLPSLPSNAASILCLFDFSRCFTLLVVGFSFEVYIRVLLYYLVRRGR
jgi:hypothetical protein